MSFRKHSAYANATLLLLLGLHAFILVRTAWLSDDAYITFRTIENFLDGHGLRWNISERVQTYTHPLWLLSLIPLRALTGEIFYTSIFFSIAVSLAALAVVAFGVARTLPQAAFAVVVLTASKAYTDYSTSGLENPLTHLLTAAFLFFFFKRDRSPRTMLVCSFTASFAALNRLDTVLVFAPLLIWMLWQARSWKVAGALALGTAPIVLWEIFSLVYYGFPFPNTAYAKLGHGRNRLELLELGLHYLLNSFLHDPITLAFIAASLIAIVFLRDSRARVVLVSAMLYLAYVVWIGGDFMSGRFLTLPLLLCAGLRTRVEFPDRPIQFLPLIAAFAALGFFPAHSPLLSGSEYRVDESEAQCVGGKGVCDERGFYYRSTGLLRNLGEDRELTSHTGALAGRAARDREVPVAVYFAVGLFAYHAGPGVHVIDPLALGDPLLARLPARTDVALRMGHFVRAVPAGYVETRRTGEIRIADARVEQYYRRLAVVTQGPLWSRARWRAIADFLFGKYDAMIPREQFIDPPAEYLYPPLIHASIDAVRPRAEGESGAAPEDLIFLPPTNGMLFKFGSSQHARFIRVAASGAHRYHIALRRGGENLGFVRFDSPPPAEEIVMVESEIPEPARVTGFDEIWVLAGDMEDFPRLRSIELVE